MKKYILASTFLALASCSNLPRHEHLIGEVRIVGPSSESLVCLKGIETKLGQTVSLYERVCRPVILKGPWVKGTSSVCEDA